MSERITRENVEARCANVNRRMESRGSKYRYVTQGRNGGIGLDRLYPEKGSYGWPGQKLIVDSTVTFGTKREIADFLHAMMVALDDATVKDASAV